MRISDSIDRLTTAATIGDENERLQMIRGLVTDEFEFINPDFVARGAEELSRSFGTPFGGSGSGVRLERTSEVERHHEHFRYTWARRRGEMIVFEGCDFGSVGPDDRMSRLVTFDHVLPSRRLGDD